jgi:hypothetical protein
LKDGNGAFFPLTKKRTIFDVGKLLAQSGTDKNRLPTIFDLKKQKKEKIDKNLNYQLKKVEDIKQTKKRMKTILN